MGLPVEGHPLNVVGGFGEQMLARGRVHPLKVMGYSLWAPGRVCQRQGRARRELRGVGAGVEEG